MHNNLSLFLLSRGRRVCALIFNMKRHLKERKRFYVSIFFISVFFKLEENGILV